LKFSASIMQHCRHQRFDRALAIFLLLWLTRNPFFFCRRTAALNLDLFQGVTFCFFFSYHLTKLLADWIRFIRSHIFWRMIIFHMEFQNIGSSSAKNSVFFKKNYTFSDHRRGNPWQWFCYTFWHWYVWYHLCFHLISGCWSARESMFDFFKGWGTGL
jgi:hypothetical protein